MDRQDDWPWEFTFLAHIDDFNLVLFFPIFKTAQETPLTET